MTDGGQRDLLYRFVLERAGVRGAIVRLHDAWASIGAQADYPRGVAGVLGQTLAASALFTAHLKSGTRLAIQLRAGGPVSSLFAECSDAGEVRGLARWQGPVPDPLRLDAIRPPAHLAITLEPPGGQRYQGLVPMDAASLEQAFEAYFAQSEQIPTRVRLAADEVAAAGLMIQQLPAEGAQTSEDASEGWDRARLLLETLVDEELLGPSLAPETVLRHLFHEERVRLFPARPLRFGCRCSAARVEEMLRQLGREEAAATLETQPQIEVTCEFCHRVYRYGRLDLERVFDGPLAPAPTTRQ